MKKILSIMSALIILFSLIACNTQTVDDEKSSNTTNLTAKYVFLLIGDGMALPQINATEYYLASKDSEVGVKKLNLSKLPSQGLTTTYAADRYITDSAAAGTALACGTKTNVGVIGLDTNNNSVKSMAEIAEKSGKKVGIISSVSIDHATPASFYAHTESRDNYVDIDWALINSPFNFYGGGGMRTYKHPDGVDIYEEAEKSGWIVTQSKADFELLKAGNDKVFAINPANDSYPSFPYRLDQTSEHITLKEYTEKAIELLDNDKGFFIMVEGGKIDWACHANDGMAAIDDTIAFDEAVGAAIDFYNKHPKETLIVVTGDHECGGMTIGFAGTGYDTYYEVLDEQTMSFEKFDATVLKEFKTNNTNGSLRDLMPEIKSAFGLHTDNSGIERLKLTDYEYSVLEDAFEQSMLSSKDRTNNEATMILYGGYEPLSVTLTHILNQKAGLDWTSYSHTGVPVPTFAVGAGQNMFDGYYDNVDIFHKIVEAMKLK